MINFIVNLRFQIKARRAVNPRRANSMMWPGFPNNSTSPKEVLPTMMVNWRKIAGKTRYGLWFIEAAKMKTIVNNKGNQRKR